MATLFPSSFEIWEYNEFGRALFYSILVLGISGGFVVSWRRNVARAASWVCCGLLACAVAAHFSTLWILAVDPHRNTGRVPLPQPFPVIAYGSAFLLALVGPPVAGFLLGHLLALKRGTGHTTAALAYASVAVYALYITPWTLAVIAD